MKANGVQGKTLIVALLIFKNHLIRYHEVEIGMPLEYRVAIAWLYEQVRCQLKTENGFLEHSLSNMGVKQGCPLSPTCFGLRILIYWKKWWIGCKRKIRCSKTYATSYLIAFKCRWCSYLFIWFWWYSTFTLTTRSILP